MMKFIFDGIGIVLTIIGAFVQLFECEDEIKLWLYFSISIAVLIIFIIRIILYLVSKSNVSYKKRKKAGNKFILNAKDALVCFGGDLSWTNDYIDSIKSRAQQNCRIEIYYDNRYLAPEARQKLDSRIKDLEDAGCFVRELKENLGIRMMVSSPNSNDMCIWNVKKVINSPNKRKKNKYKYKIYTYESDPMYMAMVNNLYRYIKQGETDGE